MSKEFFNVVASVVLLLGLLTTTATGVWWVGKLENRITQLEKLDEWQAGIEENFDIIEARQTIHSQRWMAHFQLWGDNITRRAAELNIPAPPPPTAIEIED